MKGLDEPEVFRERKLFAHLSREEAKGVTDLQVVECHSRIRAKGKTADSKSGIEK